MATARDYRALARLKPGPGEVLVLCTGWVYRWRMGRWVFVRARGPLACARSLGPEAA
jgi:hypothetical protein